LRTWKIAAAVLLTCAFVITSELIQRSHRDSRTVESADGGILMLHNIRPVQRGREFPPKLTVRVTTSLPSRLFKVFLMSKPIVESDTSAEFEATEAKLADEAIDDYEAMMQLYPTGTTALYYFKVEGINERVLLTLPADAEDDGGDFFSIRFEEIAPIWFLLLQKLSQGVVIFAVLLAFFTCFEIMKRPSAMILIGKQSFWVSVFLLANVIFSAILQQRVHGLQGWGGWPFGSFNPGDTLLEVAVVIWIVMTFLLKGSAFSGTDTGNLVSAVTARTGILAVSIITIFAILLHAVV
jgi:hypothetical protein